MYLHAALSLLERRAEKEIAFKEILFTPPPLPRCFPLLHEKKRKERAPPFPLPLPLPPSASAEAAASVKSSLPLPPSSAQVSEQKEIPTRAKSY